MSRNAIYGWLSRAYFWYPVVWQPLPEAHSYIRKMTILSEEEKIVCRNIRTLFNFDPPVTDEEIHAASQQFVRKITGFNTPSRANAAAFHAAIEEIAKVSVRLLGELESNAAPKNRAEEAAKAKARSAKRFEAI